MVRSIDGVGAVSELKLHGVDLLDDLVLLLDNPEIQAVAVDGGHPGQEKSEPGDPALPSTARGPNFSRGRSCMGLLLEKA
jgi:hypothetical protein